MQELLSNVAKANGAAVMLRVRAASLNASFCCFCIRTCVFRSCGCLTSSVFAVGPSVDVLCRIARERVPTSAQQPDRAGARL